MSTSYYFVCQGDLTEFFAELTKFVAECSEFSLPNQYPRNRIFNLKKSISVYIYIYMATYSATGVVRPVSRDRIGNSVGSLSVRGVPEHACGTCDPSVPTEEFFGLFGPEAGAELKMSSQASRPRGQKKIETESKKSRKLEIATLLDFFDSFSTPISTFLTLGPESPGNSI